MHNNNVNPKLNVVFAGTPDFAAQILKTLVTDFSINICAVYTQPDRPAGRGRQLAPSAVKNIVTDLKLNIPIEQPLTLKSEHAAATLQLYKPDLIIVVAYGLILPAQLLNIPKYGCLNIHASLLPRWRGAAPIQRAILAGDEITGISTQQMDKGLDTGPIIAEDSCCITDTDNTISLTEKLLALAKTQITHIIHNIPDLSLPKKQDDNLATYAHKIHKDEAHINWSDSAINIDRKIRAFNPWPGAQTNLKNINDEPPVLVKIIEAKIIKDHNPNLPNGSIIITNKKNIIIQTREQQIEVLKLQFSGGKIISNKDALNGKYKNLLVSSNLMI